MRGESELAESGGERLRAFFCEADWENEDDEICYSVTIPICFFL